eukprot:scaffold348481_cov32-Prasinocladus_malaysianus.AAC.1
MGTQLYDTQTCLKTLLLRFGDMFGLYKVNTSNSNGKSQPEAQGTASETRIGYDWHKGRVVSDD